MGFIYMCLYPRYIKNRKYLPNKKNGGITPIAKDERLMWVPVGCGNCIECRKQKARAWQVRLQNELDNNKHAYFVALTFSNDSLLELYKVVDAKNDNAVAALAVRRFLERWRKIHKKSLKHWLITELGHEGTERIHLHGILFSEDEITEEELEEVWKYGFCDIGKYCNTRSINYIVKYVTKIDLDHKNYRAIILCSAGLGVNYVTTESALIHHYRPRNTKEYYKLKDGTKVNLPIYYRNKFYTEEQRENLWLEKLDNHTIYVRGIECKNLDTIEGQEHYKRVLEEQQRQNEELGFGSDKQEWKKEDYNTTLRMLNKDAQRVIK